MRFFSVIFASLLLLATSLGDQTVALLRPNDTFEMRLGGMPQEFVADFAFQYTVSQDGTVNIPLIGEIKAGGLTATQLEKTIQTKLVADKIFTRPTVIISIAQGPRFVSVGGGVKAPQRLQWTSDMTLNSAVQNAGGLDDFASPKGVRLIREGKVQLFDLRVFEKDPSRDPKLLPGDQVYVPKGF